MVTAEIRVARRLYRRCAGAAGVSGRDAADDHLLHVRAGPGARRRRGRALPVPGLHHPETAAQGEPARQAARAHRTRIVADRIQESAAGIVEIHANDTVKLQLTDFAEPARAHLRHPLRDLQAQVLRQVSQQLHRAADAVFLLFDRRLSGDPRQSVVRRAGRGAGRLQGHGLAVEGTARLLSAEGRLADQVRADRRAVSARRAHRRRDCCCASPTRYRSSRASWRSAICRWPRTTAAASSTRSRFTCGSTSMSRSSGQSGSGKNELALLLARLMRPTGGRITIGGHELGELPLAVIGRPHRLCRRDAVPVHRHAARQSAARRCATGRCGRPNTTRPRRAGARARSRGGAPLRQYRFRSARRLGRLRRRRGRRTPKNCRPRIAELLTRLDFEADVYNFGLRWRFDPAPSPS